MLCVSMGGTLGTLHRLHNALSACEEDSGSSPTTRVASNVRFTGVSLSYQVASSLGAGLAPLIASSVLHASGGSNPVWIILIVVGLSLLACVTYATSKETFRSELLVTRSIPTVDEL